MKATDLFVKRLEAEGIEYISGVPGEENADFMLSLETSFDEDGPSLIVVPIDYRENIKLTERLGDIACPI